MERNNFLERLRRNHYARRVRRGMANEAFQVRRHLQQIGNAFIGFLELRQFRRLLQSLFQRDVQRRRDELGDLSASA